MKIPVNTNTPTHLQLVRDPVPPAANGADPVAPAAEERPAAPRHDSVRLSAAGRALAKADPTGEREPLSPERIAELRQKVLDGAYNSLEAAEGIARGILARGDL